MTELTSTKMTEIRMKSQNDRNGNLVSCYKKDKK